MTEPNLTRSSLKIRDVDFMNTGVLCKVDLSPSALPSQFTDALSELDTDVRGHPLRIALVHALYLAHALSCAAKEYQNSQETFLKNPARQCSEPREPQREWEARHDSVFSYQRLGK